jgi:hypothetical protein
MPNPRRIILLGSSIFIAAIEAGLQDNPGLEVARVDERTPDVERTLCAHAASTIVFDASGATPPCLVPLLQESPGLVLIGVDPSQNHALVLSMRDLAQVILREV